MNPCTEPVSEPSSPSTATSSADPIATPEIDRSVRARCSVNRLRLSSTKRFKAPPETVLEMDQLVGSGGGVGRRG